MQAGDKFGRWTLQQKIVGKKSKWLCQCECGTVREVTQTSLKSGKSKSCGCFQKEVAARTVVLHSMTHGMSDTVPFKIWESMVNRSTKESSNKFEVYGKLPHDQEWMLSFEKFWGDMSDTYFEGATIDRIDNSMGYFKENCRWATVEQQNRHRSKFKNNSSGVTGVSWSMKSGITYAVAIWREDSTYKTKSFSVKKYGLLEAFALAVQYRKDQIARLNELGYGYSETHGL